MTCPSCQLPWDLEGKWLPPGATVICETCKAVCEIVPGSAFFNSIARIAWPLRRHLAGRSWSGYAR